MNIRSSKGWSTHNTILIKTVTLSKGKVLEIGAGPFSTPLLHWICKERGLKLVTLESNPDYYKFARQFQSGLHRIRQVENLDDFPINEHWGVVFIDHDFKNRKRGLDAVKFKDNADFIVLHDTEEEQNYRYDITWPHFKYRYDWKECSPWTSVVSNFIDLSVLEKRI